MVMSAARYADRTDSVSDKLQLLAAAPGRGQVGSGDVVGRVDQGHARLRTATARTRRHAHDQGRRLASRGRVAQALGHLGGRLVACRPVDLFETVGIERRGEPVELTLAVADKQAGDLGRELRVARWDKSSNNLVEVACQVDDETAHAGQRQCRLIFLADVPAHQQASYFVFCGTPGPSAPTMPRTCKVRGEGVGLDIENHHFLARLSRQEGQLERLTSKRQHGLELYAGGKGHGEPPGIDWAHDYVDVDHFQKLRMRATGRAARTSRRKWAAVHEGPPLGISLQPFASVVHTQPRAHGSDLSVLCGPALLFQREPVQRGQRRRHRSDARR